MTWEMSSEELNAFREDGFLIKRGLFDTQEIGLLQEALATDEALWAHSYGLDDSSGGQTVIAVWNHPSDDTLGIVPRLPRIANTVATLLGGEVYHYHSKITSKTPGGGGTWDWHQDYGYWYKNGLLFPNLASVAIALSELTVENGTLRILQGSHLCGRIEHSVSGGQTGANTKRLEVLSEQLEEVVFVADPGDALFFHCNTLHSSSPNLSENTRDVLLCCFNRADNNPIIRHHHPSFTPLNVVDDGELLRTGLATIGEQRSFMNPSEDISIGEFESTPING